MDLKQLRKKIKQEFIGDWCLFLDCFGTIKYYIYGQEKDAIKHYDRMSNSMIGDDRNNKFWVEQVI